MGRFWAGFALGVFTTIVVAVAAGVAITYLYTGPAPAVSVALPDAAVVGTGFTIVVDVSNPHSENVALGNLDIPDRFFESFEVSSVAPEASAESPIGGFGSQTWFFDMELEPGASQRFTLSVTPIRPGTHVVEFDVCNSFEDCTRFVGAIDVSDA